VIRPAHGQRGVALLLALLLTALVTVLAVAVAGAESFALHRSGNLLRRAQAGEYLAGAELLAAARLRPLLQHIDDLAQRALVERFLDAFEEHALPRLPTLRAQVIHNDLNPHNVIVDAQHPEQLRNILDFGDMVRAPLVNDLGVAAAYQLGSGADALAPALEFIAAYHRRNPLQPAEQEILADLMATRLVMTLSITAWRASLHPENRDYILRNVHQAWSSLQGLAGLTRSEAQARIAAACQEESPA